MSARAVAVLTGSVLLPGLALLLLASGPAPDSAATLAAAAVALGHVAYLLYQAFGGLLALLDRRWLVPHVIAVAWGITIVAMQWPCPLTRLERALLSRADREPYATSFLDHYVFGTVLPNGTQALVYGLHLLGIVAIYVVLWHRWSQASSREPAGV